ncbi:MAG: flavodoxin domain-containing protein [Pseudomonadota bacterium]
MKLHLLHGTETGVSEMVCDDIEDALDGEYDCEVSSLSDISPNEMSADDLYIIVSSTFGTGDVPTTAKPFMDKIESQRPDLKHVRFAIFGLGDMVFAETFAHGSERIMNELKSCGAKMIGERGIYDASTAEMPEDIAIPWAKDILESLEMEAS